MKYYSDYSSHLVNHKGYSEVSSLSCPFMSFDMLLHPVVKNKYVYFCSALDFS